MLVKASAYAGAGCIAVIAGVRASLRRTEPDPLFVAALVSVAVLNTIWLCCVVRSRRYSLHLLICHSRLTARSANVLPDGLIPWCDRPIAMD